MFHDIRVDSGTFDAEVNGTLVATHPDSVPLGSLTNVRVRYVAALSEVSTALDILERAGLYVDATVCGVFNCSTSSKTSPSSTRASPSSSSNRSRR